MPVQHILGCEYGNILRMARTAKNDRILLNEQDGNQALFRTRRAGERTDYSLNVRTMERFRSVLGQKYGVFGTAAFDKIVGDRYMAKQGLRGTDIIMADAHAEKMVATMVKGEAWRQLVTDPDLIGLFAGERNAIYEAIDRYLSGGGDVIKDLRNKAYTRHQLDAYVARLIRDVANENNIDLRGDDDYLRGHIGTHRSQKSVAATAAVGLSTFKKVALGADDANLEKKVQEGRIAEGMRINWGKGTPMLFKRLKAKGFEPGFCYTNDWQKRDTRNLMAENTPLAKCAKHLLKEYGGKSRTTIGKAVAEARQTCPELQGRSLSEILADPGLLFTLKRLTFVALRDEILCPSKPDGNNLPAELKNVGTYFRTVHMVKQDYNEDNRNLFSRLFFKPSEGWFFLPERVINRPDKKHLIRDHTIFKGGVDTIRLHWPRQFANDAKVGAVRETLVNDLMRVAGVPTQEMSLIAGKYSDGGAKLMMRAKIADNYTDLDGKVRVEGRAEPEPVIRNGYINHNAKIKGIPEQKIFLLLFGDRDAVGSTGQNKGFVTEGGQRKFYAIDMGHSLEGEDVTVYDDFSIDKNKKFKNYTVFDDYLRSEKFKGVRQLAKASTLESFSRVFAEYENHFKTYKRGGGDPLGLGAKTVDKILAQIATMKDELYKRYAAIYTTFRPQLILHKELSDELGKEKYGDCAINLIDAMEKETSKCFTSVGKGRNAMPLAHKQIYAGKRTPWTGELLPNGDLKISCKKKLSSGWKNAAEHEMQRYIPENVDFGSVRLQDDRDGKPYFVVPRNLLRQYLDAFADAHPPTE